MSCAADERRLDPLADHDEARALVQANDAAPADDQRVSVLAVGELVEPGDVHADLGIAQGSVISATSEKLFQCQRTRVAGIDADAAPSAQIEFARRVFERHRLRPQITRLDHAFTPIGALLPGLGDGAVVPQIARFQIADEIAPRTTGMAMHAEAAFIVDP